MGKTKNNTVKQRTPTAFKRSSRATTGKTSQEAASVLFPCYKADCRLVVLLLVSGHSSR